MPIAPSPGSYLERIATYPNKAQAKPDTRSRAPSVVEMEYSPVPPDLTLAITEPRGLNSMKPTRYDKETEVSAAAPDRARGLTGKVLHTRSRRSRLWSI
jgi:hypothetical protein